MDNKLRQMVKSAVANGDTKLLLEAMEIAMDNDARRLEAEVARRNAAVETLRAEPKPVSAYKIITLDGRVGRRPATLYVTGVSYKPGSGYQVSKVSYHQDKAKAKEFSTTAADGVAEYLTRCGYTVHISAK